MELHILINKQFENIKDLLPFVDHVHFFDREQIQEGLVEYERPLLEPADRLKGLVKELNSQEFDSVINMRPSQNNLSRGVEDKETCQKIVEIINKRIIR